MEVVVMVLNLAEQAMRLVSVLMEVYIWILLLTYQANSAWTVVSYEVFKAASEAELGANRVHEDTIGDRYAIFVFPLQLIML
jgi:hypothetical protein